MAAHIPFSERKTPWRGVLDLVGGCYPGFMFGGQIGKWLPVFHFHEVTRAELEPYLAYLADNGYRTVTSEAIAQYVLRDVHPGPRSVALCFDDAWASLWRVAAPLLRQYGFRAIVYVSPGRVTDASGLRPTLAAAADLPDDADRSATPFVTWGELNALHASGTVDVQAHTFRHAAIFCDATPAGFVMPGWRQHPHMYPLLTTGEGNRFLTPSDLGAPLYLQRSRYSDALRYDNPEAFEACARQVRENGGSVFFERPGWAQELRTLAEKFDGRQETPAQRDAAIMEDLASARELLNSKLHTTSVRHMCFPWAVAGQAAERAAQKAGYETAFADRLFGVRAVNAGDPPYRLMRLKHQHIFRLPGRGRQMVWSGKRRTTLAAGQAPVVPKAGQDAGHTTLSSVPEAGAAVSVGNSPRVCLLISSFYPVVGGGETHARLLCSEFRRHGVSVFVLTRRRLRTSPTFEVVDDIPVHRVPPTGVPRLGKYLMMWPAFLHLVRTRKEYDLIYVCGLRVLGMVGVVAARSLGKQCVLRSESRGELSGGFVWERPDGRSNLVLKALFGWVVRARNHLLRKADCFLSISGVIREEYERCGIPPERIASITNGIDTGRFVPATPGERAAARQRLGLPDGRLFAYSGKLNRGKGLEFLVRVWREWVPRHPDCKLLLIGSGAMQFLSCEKELRDFVLRHELETSVLFIGSVTNVHEYLRASDYFLFPSESEALPLALVEALACGLPALASDIGGVRDIIQDGRNGRLAPPNDAVEWTNRLNEFVDRPDPVRSFAASGRETALAKFSIVRVAEQHLALFSRLFAAQKETAK